MKNTKKVNIASNKCPLPPRKQKEEGRKEEGFYARLLDVLILDKKYENLIKLQLKQNEAVGIAKFWQFLPPENRLDSRSLKYTL